MVEGCTPRQQQAHHDAHGRREQLERLPATWVHSRHRQPASLLKTGYQQAAQGLREFERRDRCMQRLPGISAGCLSAQSESPYRDTAKVKIEPEVLLLRMMLSQNFRTSLCSSV
jgi:hypothetical protein